MTSPKPVWMAALEQGTKRIFGPWIMVAEVDPENQDGWQSTILDNVDPK